MIRDGIWGGIVGGITFALFEMAASVVAMGQQAIFMPLRMIAAMILGEQAISPSYPLLTAIGTGTVIHFILSIAFGLIFVWIIRNNSNMFQSKLSLVLGSTLYGFLIWLINFYVVAPVFGWTWFITQTNPITQLIAHTFFYGTALGIYLASVTHFPQTYRKFAVR